MIQYLGLPLGPSSKTCQRCPLEEELVISVLSIPALVSVLDPTNESAIGLVKLGHPVPLSNLSSEENNGVPSMTST